MEEEDITLMHKISKENEHNYPCDVSHVILYQERVELTASPQGTLDQALKEADVVETCFLSWGKVSKLF